jgi:uncharacterized protein with FMN-binding domain
MSKKLKVVSIAVAVLLAIAIASVAAFRMRYKKMAANLTSEYDKMARVNLSKIPDGVYEGSFKDFLVNVSVDVEVKNRRIAAVNIKEQFAGKGYEALDTTERIVKAQNPKVDAVTGATGSSMGIMIAADRALAKAKK